MSISILYQKSTGFYKIFKIANGNGSSLRLRAFTIVSTLLAGGCLGAALGIQTALKTISKHPGNLGREVLIYQ